MGNNKAEDQNISVIYKVGAISGSEDSSAGLQRKNYNCSVCISYI